MANNNFDTLRAQARSLLFEQDVGLPKYSASSWADGDRAGTQFMDDGPEEADPIDTPISATPQMAAQLSEDEPPVDDPDYQPVNRSELAKALAALAHKLPDDAKIAEKTYAKFKKFVDEHEKVGVEVVDQGGNTEPKEVQEARHLIRNQLVTKILSEGDWDKFLPDWDEEDDDFTGPSDEDLAAVERGDPTAGEVTLADIAAEMGISTSGAKKLEADALKHFRLIYADFPGDIEKIRSFALEYFANALVELDAISPEDAAELKSAGPAANEWPPLRYFMWDTFLTNVYNKMVRDAKAQGLDPEKQLGELLPGLYPRAKQYFDGLPKSRIMKGVVDAMNVDY